MLVEKSNVSINVSNIAQKKITIHNPEEKVKQIRKATQEIFENKRKK